eukprot:scaffold34407_cov34-Attheya_sp.AAC.5
MKEHPRVSGLTWIGHWYPTSIGQGLISTQLPNIEGWSWRSTRTEIGHEPGTIMVSHVIKVTWWQMGAPHNLPGRIIYSDWGVLGEGTLVPDPSSGSWPVWMEMGMAFKKEWIIQPMSAEEHALIWDYPNLVPPKRRVGSALAQHGMRGCLDGPPGKVVRTVIFHVLEQTLSIWGTGREPTEVPVTIRVEGIDTGKSTARREVGGLEGKVDDRYLTVAQEDDAEVELEVWKVSGETEEGALARGVVCLFFHRVWRRRITREAAKWRLHAKGWQKRDRERSGGWTCERRCDCGTRPQSLHGLDRTRSQNQKWSSVLCGGGVKVCGAVSVSFWGPPKAVDNDGKLMDIRCMWDSKKNGHNQTLWAPGFMNQSLSHLLEILTPGCWVVDHDLVWGKDNAAKQGRHGGRLVCVIHQIILQMYGISLFSRATVCSASINDKGRLSGCIKPFPVGSYTFEPTGYGRGKPCLAKGNENLEGWKAGGEMVQMVDDLRDVDNDKTHVWHVGRTTRATANWLGNKTKMRPERCVRLLSLGGRGMGESLTW